MRSTAQAGVLERGLARRDGARDQVLDQRFELGPRQLQVQVGRAVVGHGDVRLVDVGLLRRRQFDLGALGRTLDTLQRDRIAAQVDATDLAELGDDVVDDALVEILAAEEGVAVGRQNLELLLAVDVGDLDDRDVEGAATQVVDGDLAVARGGLVQAEGQRGGGWFVDDALDVEAGDAAGVLGGLALGIVEVGRHGDDGLADLRAEIGFGGLLHLAQHLGRHLLRRQLVAARLDPGVAVVGADDLVRHQVQVFLHLGFVELAPDQALDGEQRVLRIGDGLALGGRADQDFVVEIGDDGRRGARAFRVFDHLGLAALHDGDARIGRAQVDADGFAAHGAAARGFAHDGAPL
jgi:hypothetical protein